MLIIGSRFLFVGKTFLLGVTFLTTFYFGLQPSNTSVVSYETFTDNSLGATVGLIITGLGISIIFPEKKRIKNEKLIKATIKELVYALKKKNLNMSNVVRHTHDRLRLSD
ncbi:FUSC family protein, partial [Enterobacter hormaechei]|uniref:FUSC family protein n=1 Tax=Enterobacter hormaechei TaxID=158836 RepID=UPI00215BB638